MYSARIERLITILVIVALCIAITPARHVFGIEIPDAAKAGKEAGPQVFAGAAIVYCENTGEVVYAKESRVKHPPYSLAKLVTAMVVIRTTPLDKEVKVSENAASQTGKLVGLKKGEKITVEKLLYGMLMGGGNDAAYALSECVSGKKTKKFVKKMNKMAKNLGCERTHFSDPAGYKSEETYTTARDFLRILRVALTDETIEKITGTKQYEIPRTNKNGSRALTSTVPLLNDPKAYVYAGMDGLHNQEHASTAVGTRKDGLRLFIVLLADKELQREADIRTLEEYAEKNVQGIQVVRKGKAMGKVRIRHGAKTSLSVYTARDGYAYLPAEGSEALIRHNLKMKEVTAPVKEGDVLGYYEICIGDKVSNRVPLIAKEAVEVGWFPSYIGISNKTTIVIMVILGVLLLLVLWILVMRARLKRQRARKRREMIREKARLEYLEEEDHRKRDWNFGRK